MNELEIITPIKDFPDYYISNYGNVLSTKKNEVKYLKPNNHKNGYKMIHLRKDGVRSAKYIHRLVGECYIANPQNKPQINHKDGNKANNHWENLEWVTNSENQKHAAENDLWINTSIKVSQFTLGDEFIKNFRSPIQAMELTGVDDKSIRKCCKNIRKSAGGFKWKFTE